MNYSGAQSVGCVVSGVSARLCKRFKHLRYGRLFTDWSYIFPDEVGLLYQPVRLSQGKLWVRASSSQAALLTYFAPSMMEVMNRYLGFDVVRSIHAQHGGRVSPPSPKRGVRMCGELSQEHRAALQGISNIKLRGAMEEWGRKIEGTPEG